MNDNLEFVAHADEIKDGERILVDIGNREVAIFKLNGEWHALANVCPHQGAPLCEGKITGTLSAVRNEKEDDFDLVYDRKNRVIACPWHAWEFDIATGEHLSNTGYTVPTYDIVVRDEKLYLKT
jgi:nitrite reductase (NADH) small subunit